MLELQRPQPGQVHLCADGRAEIPLSIPHCPPRRSELVPLYQVLINLYFTLKQKLIIFINRSYYITDAESKLLNEINLKHADGLFSKEAFTTKDLVVRLSDAKEFYRFLDLCYKKLVLKKSQASDR